MHEWAPLNTRENRRIKLLLNFCIRLSQNQ
jgi:hypothetical protein